MKLSTKSRYGTRMIMDLAQHYGQGTIQLGEIANRQKISIKYLEQIIRPLKKAGFVKRDPRVKERKKYGQKGARARFQFSKR